MHVFSAFRFAQLLSVCCSLLLSGCSPTPAGNGAAGQRNFVFWISVDGIRPDYLERADTPFIDRLMEEGAWSLEHVPVFPTLTFPSHVSKATGTMPARHGIVGNTFYDAATDTIHRYSGEASLLEAEPIWNTATRQGIRTLVFDWVNAHNQTGPDRTAYFLEQYTRGIPDEERVGRVLDAWAADDHPEPLRFILAYTQSPDTEGHRYGPGAPEVDEAMAEIDRLLATAYQRSWRLFEANRGPDDQFYFILTSDHGMSEVRTLVHPERLAGLEGRDDVVIVTGGNTGHVFLNRVANADERERVRQSLHDRTSRFPFVTVYDREDLPSEWGYAHPTRTGDVLLVLDPGYTFNRRPTNTVTATVEETGGPRGMHGYHPGIAPEMLTVAVFHRQPEPLRSGDLGSIHTLQFHATVARLLGVEPSPDALDEPILLERNFDGNASTTPDAHSGRGR